MGDGEANIKRFKFLRKPFEELCSLFNARMHIQFMKVHYRICVCAVQN